MWRENLGNNEEGECDTLPMTGGRGRFITVTETALWSPVFMSPSGPDADTGLQQHVPTVYSMLAHSLPSRQMSEKLLPPSCVDADAALHQCMPHNPRTGSSRPSRHIPQMYVLPPGQDVDSSRWCLTASRSTPPVSPGRCPRCSCSQTSLTTRLSMCCLKRAPRALPTADVLRASAPQRGAIPVGIGPYMGSVEADQRQDYVCAPGGSDW